MPTALSCLLFFIAMTPIVLFVDGTLALGFACAILAFGLIVFAQMQRPGELAHLSTLVWPVAFIMILPALLMVLQTMPLPFFSRFANPIWESASTALGRSLTAEPEYRSWNDIAQSLPLSRLARCRSSCRRAHH